MNTKTLAKLDAALKAYKTARQAAIDAGTLASILDGSLVSGDTPEIRRYNRATKAVDRASEAAYATHKP